MKKTLSILLIFCLVIVLASCGGHPNGKDIVGVWHVVDTETETDYGLGIEFTKDGKVRYGLTDDVMTALADGDKESAEAAMKGLDLIASIEYEIKSDIEMELTAKALMGFGGKETETVAYSLDGDKLIFNDVEFKRVVEE